MCNISGDFLLATNNLPRRWRSEHTVPVKNRTLYFGDNLYVLREKFGGSDGYFDLIYLDPPFNSDRSYNVLFEEGVDDSDAQSHAFEDTWTWSDLAQGQYEDLVTGNRYPQKVSDLMAGLHNVLRNSNMMAYLVMMTVRLLELHRVLKPSGTIFVHCDPTASHYLKIVMDTIFSPKYFLNEIIWHYTGGGRSKSYFSRKHDVIFWYAKSNEHMFNIDDIRVPYKETSGFAKSGITSKSGKKYMPNPLGTPIDDTWDIPIINPMSKERLGYPTQKPEELLTRIIKAASNEGSWILDPFGGCGTAVAVAERLHRNWVMIDITPLSINLVKRRLIDTFPNIEKELMIDGYPTDFRGAKELASRDRFGFELWACDLVQARPSEGKTRQNNRGADRGIDGVIVFKDVEEKGSIKPIHRKLLVQVKSGANISSKDIRDLRGTIEREHAAGGVFITLEEPTKPMIQDCVEAGTFTFHFNSQKYPIMQMVTVKELIEGKKPNIPPVVLYTRKAEKVNEDETMPMNLEG